MNGPDLAKDIQRAFEQAGVPPGVLADVWREAMACPEDGLGKLDEDLRLIWTRPVAALRAVGRPGSEVDPAMQAALAAMCWVGQFVLLARRPCPLRADVQEIAADFFARAIAEALPGGQDRKATRLRIYTNARREPSFGGLVLWQDGVFYAAYGPQPGSQTVAVARCATWTAAVCASMRFLASMTEAYQNLTPAGAVDYSSWAPDWSPWVETCPRCQSPVGPSGLCYTCADFPAPDIVDPLEAQRIQKTARDAISTALRQRGVLPTTAYRVWRGVDRGPAPSELAEKALPDARRLLAWLGLPDTLLRGLDSRDLAACARLYWVASAGRDAMHDLAQQCYRSLAMQDLSGARSCAERHDRLAQIIGVIAALTPLVAAYAGGRVSEETRRPLAQLISARTGAPQAATLLAHYLETPSDRPTPLAVAAVKALQWLAELSPYALPPLTQALRHPASVVRLAAVQALGLAATWGRAPPAALLGQLAKSDWNPLVRQWALTVLLESGAPMCSDCGQPLASDGGHKCPGGSVDVWEDLLPLYEQTLLGLRPGHGSRVRRLAQALVAAETPGAQWSPDVIASLLQQESVAPSTRLHALMALADLQDVEPRLLFPLLRSPNWVVSALACTALRSAGVDLAAHPDLAPAILSQAATMAERGQLHLAALALPDAPMGDWAREYPSLLAFFQSVYYCPACGELCTGPGHRCRAPLEVQLEALAGIERLLETPAAVHPLASMSLLAQYNALAAALQLPPHPRYPVLPAPNGIVPPDVLAVLTAPTPDQRIQAARTLAREGSLRALLGLAMALPAAGEPERAAFLQALGELGLAQCPDCGRLAPLAWKHRCRTARLGVETIPASWQVMSEELEVALGPLADQPVGQLFAFVILRDPDLSRVGVSFSRLHALLVDDPEEIPPAAMLAQAGPRWFAIIGPSADGQLFVEEHADRQAAYRLAQAFLRQEAERLAQAETGLQLSAPEKGDEKDR